MLLASVDDVRIELTFDDIPDIEKAITGALKSTSRILERRLRTDFAFGSFTDTFAVDPNRLQSKPQLQISTNLVTPRRSRVGTGLFANSPLYETQFLLSHGFVASTAIGDLNAVSATMINNFGDSDLEADLRIFEGDGKDHTFTNAEEGRLYVHQIDVRGLFVQIAYNAGFTAASDDVYDNVPGWLETAAILHAQIMLDKNPVIRRPEGAESMIEVLLREYNQIVDEKVRYFPSAVKTL